MQSIEHIQIFGERCSGTSYLKSLVDLNFSSARITREFGGKHWFVKEHQPRCGANNTTDNQCIRSIEHSDDTCFLLIVRNPFDWLRSMAVSPYHAPGHFNLGFSDFIREPWASFERTRIHPLWSESTNGHYEIESAGNLLQLRSMKMLHWLNLGERVKHLEVINYEKLRDHPELLVDVAGAHGIGLCGNTFLKQTRYCRASTITNQPFEPRRRPPIREDDLEFIEQELDWEIENRLGYSRDSYEDDG